MWTFNRLKQSPDFKALFEPFSEAKAVDDLTVDLVTKGPYPLVLNLATYIFPMDREFYTGTDERGRPKDEIVKHGASFASNHVSGTGPFIVTEREQGVKLEFKRFADYWDKASPGNVDHIVFTPIKEPATRVAALLAGDVDFISPVPPTDFDRIKNDPCCQLITMLEHAHPHLRAEPSPRRGLQGSARAPRHQLRDQPAGHRRQDHARLRHAGGRAQPAGLCRL